MRRRRPAARRAAHPRPLAAGAVLSPAAGGAEAGPSAADTARPRADESHASEDRLGRGRRLRGSLVLALVGALRRLLRTLGWRGAQRLGAGIGRLAWPLARRDRRRTLEHLALAFPQLDAAERRRLGRDSFVHFGTLLCECLLLFDTTPEEVLHRVAVEGWEEIDALRAAGRPILVITGHCGNWELLCAFLNSRGLPLTVVGRALDDDRLDALLVGLRARFGARTLGRGTSGAARELLRTLRSGRALGMLIDQDTKVDGVFVPFFGRPAFTPVGAASIALRQGVAALPVFIERRADGSHLTRVLPPLELPPDPLAATAAMTAAIEAQVRRRPEQWVWMHRRWRRQPLAETAAPAPSESASGPDPVSQRPPS